MGLTYFSGRKSENQGVMATQPAPVKPGPVQTPVPDSVGQPAVTTAPQGAPDAGSKAKDVPK